MGVRKVKSTEILLVYTQSGASTYNLLQAKMTSNDALEETLLIVVWKTI